MARPKRIGIAKDKEPQHVNSGAAGGSTGTGVTKGFASRLRVVVA